MTRTTIEVMVEVEVAGVKVDLRSNSPVLLLQEMGDPFRVIPIFIGAPEANAIDLALSHVVTPRPLTHDLMKTVIDGIDAGFDRAVVTAVRGDTYLAEIVLVVAGVERVLSARPSDAVALALRFEASIYVNDSVMDAEGIVFEENSEDSPSSSPEQIVGQFRDFLNNVKPEDFSD
ncbi:MAG: bifunctional nuclease family protein [Ferrimicrobium sp.]